MGGSSAAVSKIISLSDVIHRLMPVLAIIWIVGMVVILGYGIVTYVGCRQMVKQAVRLQKNIWECDTISSPFVLGIISPRIYIPFHMKEEEQKYILAHERYHIRRRDYLVKPFAFILLAIYWLNPLSWMAFRLMSRDMEMSCDEAVLEKYGNGIKKLYSSSLLSFAEDNKKYSFAPISFGEADASKRIRNVLHFRPPKRWLIVLIVLVIAVFGIACLTNAKEKTDDNVSAAEKESITGEVPEKNITDQEIKELDLNIHIDEHYATAVGNRFNLYYIDENHILWGSGDNDFGQLGQGTVDQDFHEELVKIAENVIHADNSNIGFTIYLTEDHKLYGIGNNCGGALLDNKEVSHNSLLNPHLYTVSEPKLLMSGVKYAKCGQNDVVCILEDNTAWRWGTTWHDGLFQHSILEPEKILDNVALITGGWYNHAALLTDGSVWTWGYNYAGNCGVKDEIVVSEPTKAAEDVVMVWTGAPSQVDTKDISDLSINLSAGENTIIRKKDGSYWACGADLGEEKVLPRYWEVNDYSITCTSEFVPIYNEYAIKHDDQISENIIIGENSYNIPIFSVQEKENEIYKNAVIALEETGYLPDGTYCYVENDEGFERQKAKAYPNKIVVSDVNNDGARELLIWIGGTCNADFAQYIYRYSKEKECFELLFEYYAGYDFYSNGLICANVSHSNYIYADDFWPYEVFEYNLQTGQ